MADSSFDVVSKIDLQEMKNAIDQAMKEIGQRFDFRGSKTQITLEADDTGLTILSDDDYKLKAVNDILQSKLVKRGISPKSLDYQTPEAALGGTMRQKVKLKQGIASEKAKEISKFIRDGKWKVQAQIQGDQLRVASKSKDELQAVIAALRQKDFDLPLQFTNYR